MVVQFVPHGDLLFSELCQQLPVDLDTTRDSRSWHLLLEDTANVMEQSRDGQHDRRRLQIIPVVQEKLSVLIPPCG